MPTLADPHGVLSSLIRTVIVPQLCAAIDAARSPPTAPSARNDPAAAAAARLAGLLRAADVDAAFRLACTALSFCGSLEALASTLLEPTARCFGDLWQADDCTDVDVSLGLIQLQAILRELGRSVPRQLPAKPAPSVLVVPLPGESHQLGAAFDAEMLWHAGWSPRVDFPATDDALDGLVGRCWIDALDVSLSTSFRREHRLAQLDETIRRARRASRNPDLVVVVSGRVFGDPLADASIERAGLAADASFASAAEAEVTIRRALQRPASERARDTCAG